MRYGAVAHPTKPRLCGAQRKPGYWLRAIRATSQCSTCSQSKEAPMKAAYIEQTGGPEVLQYGERPDPKAAADDVLVGVAAASVNAADWKTREGSHGTLTFPY